jgi:LysW-gamma-L-lysine carboxypeptidase
MGESSDNPVDFLIQLLKTESLSGSESQIATILTQFLSNHGFQILPSSIGNVIGIKGNGHPILLLASHMDTVPTNNPFRDEGDIIYGTGSVDCKPALAALFYSAAIQPWPKEWGTLIVAGIVQEETATLGIEEIFDLNLKPDLSLFGEPTQSDQICLGYRGRLLVNINIDTEPGHSGIAWEYDNPIDLCIEIYHRLKSYESTFKQKNKPKMALENHFHEISVTMTVIHAGSETNVIPAHASAVIDIRLPPNLFAEQIEKEVKTIIHEIKQKLFKSTTKLSYEIDAKYDAVDVPPDVPIVNALRWAIFQETKHKAVIVKKTGSTLTNLIQKCYCSLDPGFACITYGPGDSRLEHTNNEKISKTEYLQSISVLHRFFPKLFDILRR